MSREWPSDTESPQRRRSLHFQGEAKRVESGAPQDCREVSPIEARSGAEQPTEAPRVSVSIQAAHRDAHLLLLLQPQRWGEPFKREMVRWMLDGLEHKFLDAATKWVTGGGGWGVSRIIICFRVS